MKQFKISPNLDKNKVFIVNSSDIEGRLDPLFYSNNIFGFLKEAKFDIKTIREISQYTIAGFGVGKEGQNLDKEGYIQIRPTNVDEYGLLKFDKNIYLDEEYLTKKLENIIQKDDVLFNNTNSQELVGKTSYFDLDQTCFHSNHITRIKVNEDLILPKYLWRLLNFYQKRKIFYSICTNWNNQSGVGIELLNSLKIPVPPKETQEKIVQIMDNAYLLKKQNEAEAEKLLASIDDYLLGELGIKLPSQPKNSLKNRIFYTSLKEISGQKWDAFYYGSILKKYDEALFKAKYPIEKLGKIANIDWGNTNITKASYIENGFPAFSATGKDGFLDFYEHEDDAIILSAIGARCGKCFLATDKWTAIKNTIVIIPKTEINIKFLHAILDNEKLWNRSGGAQPFITMESAFYKKIPLPPLPKQQEIANHITKIRIQAQLLKEQANTAIKQANQEIEQILLGN